MPSKIRGIDRGGDDTIETNNIELYCVFKILRASSEEVGRGKGNYRGRRWKLDRYRVDGCVKFISVFVHKYFSQI